MSVGRMKLALLVAIMVTVAAALAVLSSVTKAGPAAPPVKLVLAGHFGWEVNEETKGPVCPVTSKCQAGKASSMPGGFEYPQSAAGAPGGGVYVADPGNHRVQELTSGGEFVLMFGREVNETTKGDVCTAEEIVKAAVKCKAGVAGSAAGQFSSPQSVAVDPASGAVYVAEIVFGKGTFGERVQKLTAAGQFVLEIGGEVNEKTKGNLCTREEEEKEKRTICVGPAQREPGTPASGEHGSFNFESGRGNLLSVGPGGLLYAGDEGRVQEFDANGEFTGEITLAPGGQTRALAVDETTAYLYLVYEDTNIIRRLGSKGESAGEPIEVNGEAGTTTHIRGLAIDPHGHLAVAGFQEAGSTQSAFGSLYDASSGAFRTAFVNSDSVGVVAVGFDGQGRLYAPYEQEILAYNPEPVAELVTGAAACKPGVERETDITIDCALNGEVDPEGVSETKAWFEWGPTRALGTVAPGSPILIPTGNTLVLVPPPPASPGVSIENLRPNDTYYYRLAGEDQNVKSPEELTGERRSLTTELVAPKIVGLPSVSFVKASSAVISGEMNPENATTEAFAEYAPGAEALAKCPGGVRSESCPGVSSTPVMRSGIYGETGVTVEARGLQAGTLYSYRISAESENRTKTERKASHGEGSQEGTFTTAPAPVPSAQTGSYSTVTATSAIVTGAVNPNGLPATYAFELGVYNGAGTQYGVVFSGPVGASSVPVEEILALTGLQPGTQYAYRITVSSGYIANESHTLQGEPVVFATLGLPSVLQSPMAPPTLSVPQIAFPQTPKAAVHKAAKRKTKHHRKGKARKRKSRKGRK
jgi:hypothetical protein